MVREPVGLRDWAETFGVLPAGAAAHGRDWSPPGSVRWSSRNADSSWSTTLSVTTSAARSCGSSTGALVDRGSTRLTDPSSIVLYLSEAIVVEAEWPRGERLADRLPHRAEYDDVGYAIFAPEDRLQSCHWCCGRRPASSATACRWIRCEADEPVRLPAGRLVRSRAARHVLPWFLLTRGFALAADDRSSLPSRCGGWRRRPRSARSCDRGRPGVLGPERRVLDRGGRAVADRRGRRRGRGRSRELAEVDRLGRRLPREDRLRRRTPTGRDVRASSLAVSRLTGASRVARVDRASRTCNRTAYDLVARLPVGTARSSPAATVARRSSCSGADPPSDGRELARSLPDGPAPSRSGAPTPVRPGQPGRARYAATVVASEGRRSGLRGCSSSSTTPAVSAGAGPGVVRRRRPPGGGGRRRRPAAACGRRRAPWSGPADRTVRRTAAVAVDHRDRRGRDRVERHGRDVDAESRPGDHHGLPAAGGAPVRQDRGHHPAGAGVAGSGRGGGGQQEAGQQRARQAESDPGQLPSAHVPPVYAYLTADYTQ